MTVSYSLDVSEAGLFGFFRLQLRWRGSIWKSVLSEVIPFCFVFLSITFVYRTDFFINAEQRKFWDDLSALFDDKMDYIPLTFMLGFFVTIILNRWNEVFNNVGFVDPAALAIATYVRGADEKSRIIRRNVVRYLVVAQVLVYRDISMQVRKRFPTLETVEAAGLINKEEMFAIMDCPVKYCKYFLPIQWAFTILYEARVAGKISADVMLNEIIKIILDFRKGLAKLCNFDWVPIPLVYPQVVFLAVRSYFVITLVARQSVLIDGEAPNPNHPVFPLVPFIMTTLQFIFYVGWMKVAESLMNPLGEDDDDFECNFLIDRNLQMGLTIVDETYSSVPAQVKDQFWSDRIAEPLYSADTASKHISPQVGSAAQYEPSSTEVLMKVHDSVEHELNSMDGDDEARLLPRAVSIVSINTRGSRMSLNSRKNSRHGGLIGTLKKQFSRDGRLSRPSRLGIRSSQSSLTTPNELGSNLDLMEEKQEDKNSLTVDTPLKEVTPRRSPAPPVIEGLSSVPEEDEDTQRTRTSTDLRRWLNEVNNKDPLP